MLHAVVGTLDAHLTMTSQSPPAGTAIGVFDFFGEGTITVRAVPAGPVHTSRSERRRHGITSTSTPVTSTPTPTGTAPPVVPLPTSTPSEPVTTAPTQVTSTPPTTTTTTTTTRTKKTTTKTHKSKTTTTAGT